MPNTLLIISGPPCTGKTTLGKKIASEFGLPFLSRDVIKESLFDTLGIKDRAWSKKLGVASYHILYHTIETFLPGDQPFIVESNFRSDFDNNRFTGLQEKYGFTTLQIMCRTEGAVLFDRFRYRSESGERHPGHMDDQNYGEFKKILLRGSFQPLNLQGQIFTLDTTDFNLIDYQALFEAITLACINNVID